MCKSYFDEGAEYLAFLVTFATENCYNPVNFRSQCIIISEKKGGKFFTGLNLYRQTLSIGDG